MRSGVLLLLVFVFTRDLSNSKCLTPLVNQEVNSSGLAVGQELSSFVGFEQPVRKKTSSGRHFGFSLTPVAKVQLVRLTRSVLLASLLLQCNDISVNPGPSTKITCPRCLKTVRRNQAFGFCVLCKSRFHLKCLDANFESGSTCHFCSVPSSAEQQFDDSLNDSFVVPATSDATLKLRGLKFIHQNIRSLRKKLNELRVFITQSPRIHIIALTETWLNSNISDAEVSLPGFTLFRRDRLVRKGGGVAVFVSESINAVRRSDLEIDESVWIEIFLPKSKSILFGTFYRPPSESDSQPDVDYLARVYNSLDSAAAEGKEIVVNGDFNCDYLPKKPSSETK
ncbi:uncharacterized protein LOC110044121, partial [Orbicella faveolata]|uniref:uncharacterized protein LOC110044121 n=1 Tax=Orbicella faveolata TaxID=48498 RepID=UPI0009E30257